MKRSELYLLLKDVWDDTIIYGVYDDVERMLADYSLVIETEDTNNIIIKEMPVNTLNGIIDNDFGFVENSHKNSVFDLKALAKALNEIEIDKCSGSEGCSIQELDNYLSRIIEEEEEPFSGTTSVAAEPAFDELKKFK